MSKKAVGCRLEAEGRRCCTLAAAMLGWLISGHALAAEYAAVTPNYRIAFPQDEGSHPEFRTEWWYVTGWTTDAEGNQRGFQVTFFRHRTELEAGNPSRFAARQLLFAHAAVSDPATGRLLHDERAARAGFDLAEAREGRTSLVLEDWSLDQEGDVHRARIPAAGFALELDFRRTQPPLLQGAAGFSQKGPDPQSASHYYSLPQLEVTGRIRLKGSNLAVSGTAWFDHEWSSTLMDEAAQGWDWLGINLDDGGALMAFRMRDRTGGEHWAAGSVRDSSGTRMFSRDEIDWEPARHWRSPRTGIEYPVAWDVRVGERTFLVRPLFDDQESDARRSTGTIYWEGAVELLDETGRVVGRGYLELTGYGSRLRL